MLVPSERVAALFRALLAQDHVPLAAPRRKRPDRGTLFDAVIVLLASLLCLLFVGSLRDTPLRFFHPAGLANVPAAAVGDGKLRVHVVGPDSKPLPDAVVRVFSIAGDRVYLGGEAKTGPEGVLDFGELPRGETWIVAYGEAKARVSAKVTLTDRPRDLELMLVPAVALEARVVDAEGKPIPGIEIVTTGIDPLPHVAVSDADGHVLFDRLGAAPFVVSVDVSGFDPVVKRGVFPGSDPLVLRLERLGGFEVHVTTHDGQPAVGATVLLSGPGIWPARSTETDEDGIARINALRTGVYDLKARLGALVSPTEVSIPLQKGLMQRRELVLTDGDTLRVRVIDGEASEGAEPVPIEGAKVSVIEEGLTAFPLEEKTNKDGEALIGPVSTDAATILARAEGFVASSVARSTEKDGVVTVPLLRGGVIEGDVVDERGYPIDGASVEVFGSDRFGMPISQTGDPSSLADDLFAFSLSGAVPLIPRGELGVVPGPVPDIPRAGSAMSHKSGGEPWVSRLDGTFSAKPVTPGRVQVLVRHPDYIEEETDVMTLAPGATAKVHIVLRLGGRIEGRVLEESRQPVAGVRLEIVATQGTFEAVTYTADDGTFAVAAAPEEVMITASRPETPGDVAARLVVSITPKQKNEVEIVLPKVREDVSLKVDDDRHQPIARVEARVTSLDVDTALSRTLFTDDDGKVAIPGARGLPLRIVLEHPGKAPTSLTVDEAGSGMEATMHDALTMHGVVTARGGRDKVDGADLTLYTDTGTRHATSNVDGEYDAWDLAEGRIRIVTTRAGYATSDEVVFFTGDPLHAITIGPIDLALAGEVSGRVLDSGGDGVAGARVALGAVPTYLPVGKLPSGIAQTDKNGAFTLGGLPEGKVSLEAYSPDLGRGEVVDIDVRADRTTDRVEIRIPDQDYHPPSMRMPASVAVTLADRDNRLVILAVPAGSEAEYAGLQPDDTLVAVSSRPVHTPEEARDLLSGPIGHDVIVDIERKGVTAPQKMKLRVRREAVRR